MKAAIVEKFGTPPVVQEFAPPVSAEGETIVDVTAAPLSPIVRARAAGTHYSSASEAGFIAGVDGVGTDPQGRRVYFLFPKAPYGSMAKQTLVADTMLVPVPDGIADDHAAAIATAGLASWVALTRRARVQPGETVLVSGATGASGAMAVEVARHLGATRVVAVGRNASRLERLDADSKIALDDRADAALRAEFDRGVDIVLDFLWGEPASRILDAAAARRGSPLGEPRLRFVQIGTSAGEAIPIRGDILRGSGLELIGSGIGSVPVRDLLAAAGELLDAAATAGFKPLFEAIPLDQVGAIWRADPGIRYIVRPDVAG